MIKMKVRENEEKKEKEELMHDKNPKLHKDVKKVSKSSNRCFYFSEESDTSDEADDTVYFDSDEDFGLENFSNKEVQKYGINDFVIVNYKEDYFSGQMKDLFKNDGKTMT